MRAIMKFLALILVISYLFYHTFWVMILLLPLVFPYIRKWEYEQEVLLRGEFQIQFKDYLQALATALSTGYALENAMREARKDLVQQYDDTAKIMRDTIMMERLLDMNMPAEQVWQEWAQQVEVDELTRFATVFIVAKRSGGDSIAIIRNAIVHICESLEVEQDIQVLLSGKKMEFKIMSFVPIGILIYMRVSFGSFMSVLYGNLFGVIVMTICLGIYGGAILWGSKIIEIEV